MKDSELLKKARCLIERKLQYRICYAISAVGGDYDFHTQTTNLIAWVSSMLGDETFYEDWLIKYHSKFAKSKGITTLDHKEKLRPGRLAWLDWMIAYCEKEEATKASKPIILNKKSRPTKELQ